MPDLLLYDKLLQFPLFQGMSRNDLAEIVAYTRLGFHKFKAGEEIVRDGNDGNHLYFLVDGKIRIMTAAADHAFIFSEYRSAPETFQLEALFGLNLHFSHTYQATSDCSLITIAKEDVRKFYNSFLVFRINYINLITSRLQKLDDNMWRPTPTGTRHRIIHFLRLHCLYIAGEKDVDIKMKKLAEELHESRFRISQALNEMDAEGLIRLSRGKIHIPALEKLLM